MNFIFPFHIWDVILPIDELHHFSRWLLHHQPEDVKKYLQWIGPCDPNFLKKLGKRQGEKPRLFCEAPIFCLDLVIYNVINLQTAIRMIRIY